MRKATRILVCVLVVAAVGVLAVSPVCATITTVADYTFNDNAAPSGFTVIGTPTYNGGQLVLDGASALEIATPLTATDNFGMETIVTPSAFDSFNFALSNTDGANRGVGLVSIGSEGTVWQGILERVGVFGSATAAVNAEIRLALVRNGETTTLYVNGVDHGTTTNTPDVGTGLTTLSVGCNRNNAGAIEGLFKGRINEVRLFTFAAGEFNASTDLLTHATVPEPSTVAILITGVLGLLAYAWRKRKQ